MNDKHFDRAFEGRFGIPIQHASVKGQMWGISKFDKEDLQSQGFKWGKSHADETIRKVEAMMKEIITKPGSTIKPKLIRGFDGKMRKILFLWNVLLLVGLEQAAKRDTNDQGTETPGGVSHMQLGTNGATENETNATHVLTAAGNRKDYDVDGSRAVAATTQLAKYIMTFSDTDGFTPPVTIREGGQVNDLTAGIGHSRVQIPDLLFESGDAILTQINELQANG